jgi:hypothetical protein
VARYRILADKVHVLDALKPQGAAQVRAAAAAGGPTGNTAGDPCCAAFVDIGGDRHAEAVLALCHQSLRAPPTLVVKCRLLFKAALQAAHAAAEASEQAADGSLPAAQNAAPQDAAHPDAAWAAFLASWWVAVTSKAVAGDGSIGSAGIGTPKWQLQQRNDKERRRAEARWQRELEQERLLRRASEFAVRPPATGAEDSGAAGEVDSTRAAAVEAISEAAAADEDWAKSGRC